MKKKTRFDQAREFAEKNYKDAYTLPQNADDARHLISLGWWNGFYAGKRAAARTAKGKKAEVRR